MEDEDNHYDDYAADQDASFRLNTKIKPDDLATALRSLEQLRGVSETLCMALSPCS